MPQSLTGAQGFISTKSFVSLELTLWTLQRLLAISQKLKYENTNMLSLMTLAIEHFHATTHLKSSLMTQLQYSREFMTSVTESIKRNCTWSAHYFTSRKGSWYPPSEDTIHFEEVKPYLPKKSAPCKISKKDEEELQQWSASYTQAVRQRTVRQETTMAKMGTLPYYIYSKNVDKIAESTSKYQLEERENLEESDSEIDEFDSSSDEDAPITCGEIDDRTVFLVGRTSRFGRTVKLSNKLLS